MPLIPYVIEKSGREERAMDIYSRLLKDRIIFLGSAINDEVANAIVAQLLFLQSEDPKAQVHLYINSPGGSVTRRAWPSTTRCSSSVARWPPTAWARRRRWPPCSWPPGPRANATPCPIPASSSTSPWPAWKARAEDIMIHAKEFSKIKERLNQILLKHTGHPLEKIEKDTDRDRFMSAEEARDYGLIDHVVERVQPS